MSSLAARLTAEQASGQTVRALFARTEEELTTNRAEAAAAENTSLFNYDSKAGNAKELAAQAGEGMIKGVNGNIGDSLNENVSKEERDRRIRNIRAVGEANVLSTLDNMIGEIDLQIAETEAEIAIVKARLQEKYGIIIKEGEIIEADIEAIEAAKTAEAELARAAAEKAAAEEKLRHVGSADEAIAYSEEIAAAEERHGIALEELERRREVLRSREIDPDRMDARLEHMQDRLDEIQAEIDSDPDSARLTKLKGQLESLTARRENLVKLKEQYEANPNKYHTVGELIDSMPEAERAAINSTIDNIISSPRWEKIEATITGAVDAVVEVATDTVDTVVNGVTSAVDTVTDGINSAVDSVSEMASSALDSVTNFMSPEPTGDRVGTTAASKLDENGINGAVPATMQPTWTAAVKPGLGHPAQEREFVPAPAPEMRI